MSDTGPVPCPVDCPYCGATCAAHDLRCDACGNSRERKAVRTARDRAVDERQQLFHYGLVPGIPGMILVAVSLFVDPEYHLPIFQSYAVILITLVGCGLLLLALILWYGAREERFLWLFVPCATCAMAGILGIYHYRWSFSLVWAMSWVLGIVGTVGTAFMFTRDGQGLRIARLTRFLEEERPSVEEKD